MGFYIILNVSGGWNNPPLNNMRSIIEVLTTFQVLPGTCRLQYGII